MLPVTIHENQDVTAGSPRSALDCSAIPEAVLMAKILYSTI